MKEHYVTVNIDVTVKISDEKLAEILLDYKEVIDAGADEQDVIKQIAYSMALEKYSGKDFVEGVGSLSAQGIEVKVEGINTEIM